MPRLALAVMFLAVTAHAQSVSSDQAFAQSLRLVRTTVLTTTREKKAGLKTAQAADQRAKPDFAFTPGRLCNDTDSDFQEYRYPEHIPYCRRNVTQQMKVEVAAHYGVPQGDWSSYEFDHLIPLAIGGDSHVDNLWPQPRGESNSDGKDKLENQLYLQMKAGTVTQADAVKEIYAWFDVNQALHRLTPPLASSR